MNNVDGMFVYIFISNYVGIDLFSYIFFDNEGVKFNIVLVIIIILFVNDVFVIELVVLIFVI